MHLFDGVVEHDQIATVTRFVVYKEYRGTDVSARLMEISFRKAARNNIELILGNCEPHLVSHYIPYGFRPFGEMDHHSTNGLRVGISIVCGDLEYLKSLNSPMLDAFSQRSVVNNIPALLTSIICHDPAVVNQGIIGHQAYAGKAYKALTRAAVHNRVLSGLIEDEAAMEALVNKSQMIRCTPGDSMIRKGHCSHTIYILLEGSLIVSDDNNELARINQPGALIGEVAFFTGQKRSGNVYIGKNGARLMALSVSNLKRLIAEKTITTAAVLYYVSHELATKLGNKGFRQYYTENPARMTSRLLDRITLQCAMLNDQPGDLSISA